MPKEVPVQVRNEIEALEMCASLRTAEKRGRNSNQSKHAKLQVT